MTTNETINRRELDDSAFKAIVAQFAGSAGHMWQLASDVSLAAFGHANSNTHSPDRVKTAYKEIYDADVSTVEKAYKRAAFACCALTLSIKDSIVSSKFDKEQWAKIQASGIDPMDSIENRGLKAYKVVVKRGSKANPITAKNLFQADYTNKIGELMAEIFKADKDNAIVAGLRPKLDHLIKQLEKEVESINARKLTDSMKPSNDDDASLDLPEVA